MPSVPHHGAASVALEPLLHAVVVGYYVVGVVEPAYLLLGRERFAAEAAQVVYYHNYARSPHVGHAAHQREIFFQRILQQQRVAAFQAEGRFYHSGERQEEVRQLVVVCGLPESGVAEAHAIHNLLYVSLGLVARAAQTLVVARKILTVI